MPVKIEGCEDMQSKQCAVIEFSTVEKTPATDIHHRMQAVYGINVLGLIHTASRAEPNRTDSAGKTNLRYEMEAFTLHAEPSRAELDRALPSMFTGRCLFLLASRRPILLRSRSNFLRLSACFFYNECKYIGLQSINQCGAVKTGFVGTK
jgi:hypothetical protein